MADDQVDRHNPPLNPDDPHSPTSEEVEAAIDCAPNLFRSGNWRNDVRRAAAAGYWYALAQRDLLHNARAVEWPEQEVPRQPAPENREGVPRWAWVQQLVDDWWRQVPDTDVLCQHDVPEDLVKYVADSAVAMALHQLDIEDDDAAVDHLRQQGQVGPGVGAIVVGDDSSTPRAP